MRTPTPLTQADTPGPRNPIRVDRGDLHRAAPLPYLDHFTATMKPVSLSAFRVAEKEDRR